MKTYAIALERSSERFYHITNHLLNVGLDFELVKAVDGRRLSQNEIDEVCDIEELNRVRWWLNNGAIGCALSHLEAYVRISVQSDSCAFIIEDDAVLPLNISEILDEIEAQIKTDEVILLYYTSKDKAELSTKYGTDMKIGSLYYPVDINQPITATAYVIGKQAATNLSKTIIPIRVTADSWGYYYKMKCFSSLRIHYPRVVHVQNYKSSIDYLNRNSLKGKLSEIINKYRVPFFELLLRHRRQKMLDKMLDNFILTDKDSPIQSEGTA